jgi:glycosyltransferase involved in cell wall biosynthesis
VIAGMRTAAAPWVVVLDGDLQHPPELVPALVATGRATCADLVYGTRHSGRGTAHGLDGALWSLVSRLCTFLAKIAFPRRLRGISDPMSVDPALGVCSRRRADRMTCGAAYRRASFAGPGRTRPLSAVVRAHPASMSSAAIRCCASNSRSTD